MIRITIKVKNDHCSFTEHFEEDTLILDPDNEYLQSLIKKVIEAFSQPVDEVTVKTKMDI